MTKDIVVTGMGIVSSIGSSVGEFTLGLRNGRCGISHLNENILHSNKKFPAGIIKNFSYKNDLEDLSDLPEDINLRAKKIAQRAPFPLQASILSALQAWQQAKLSSSGIDPHRIGIVVSCDNTTQLYQYEANLKFHQSPEYLSPRYILHSFETDYVSSISGLFQVKGEGFVVSGASASGNVAIIKAAQLLELGLVDACLVVGVPSDLSPLAVKGFIHLGAMGGESFQDFPWKACRPFDKKHEGFIYGQGSGCLILESLNSANKRNIKPLSYYLGGALTLDGNSGVDPSESGEAYVMKECLKKANIFTKDVDYINAHGTSTPLGDITEINAIKKVFHDNLDKIYINSTKSLIGHCLFSAGIIEAISCIIQMNDEFIHPNLNLEDPIDNSCLLASKNSIPFKTKISMNNSFGFGGINTSLILSKTT
jgi:malonyl-ACP decarboxylase